jgi:hypothetical protein
VLLFFDLFAQPAAQRLGQLAATVPGAPNPSAGAVPGR